MLLCLYIVVGAADAVLTHRTPESAPAGLVLAIAAVVAMPILARRKRVIAAVLDSAALRGDAACSLTCAYMAATLLLGLLLTALLHWWWADSVAALGFLYWLGRAGTRGAHGGPRRAWRVLRLRGMRTPRPWPGRSPGRVWCGTRSSPAAPRPRQCSRVRASASSSSHDPGMWPTS
ncbi:MAG: hypothetical protein NVSMB65_12310 [Chloroflexota bacterium]